MLINEKVQLTFVINVEFFMKLIFRYELPPPPSGKLNEISAWTECVDNSCAQLEHQAVRVLNLQLMLQYCVPAWQRYLSSLSEAEKIATRELQSLRYTIFNFIYFKRKINFILL